MEEELAGIVTDEKGSSAGRAEERSFVGGGRAMWLSTPPPKVPDCKVCGAELGFVAQIYAPVSGHRALHVFACDAHATEDGGWSVLRTQCSIEEEEEKKQPKNKWASADAWNSDSDDEDEEEQEALKEEKAPCVGRNVSWVLSRVLVDEEEEDGDEEMAERAKAYLATDDELAASTKRFVEDALAGKVGDLTVSGQDDEEKYEAVPESAAASVAFAARLRKHPTQVVRYAYGAVPLGTKRRASPPRCGACGSERIFECDLLPTLIYYLDKTEMDDWTSVSVYSCAKSCPDSSQEFVSVS